LGVEVPFSEIPGYQADVIQHAQSRGKPVIVATQVMESMIENSRPTRAEATDVAHSVMAGTDAIMLSGETALGKYPLEAVKALSEIIEASERRWWQPVPTFNAKKGDISWLVAQSACRLADETETRFIVITTRTGASAIRTSRFRPKARVVVLAADERVRRKLTLVRGVETVLMRRPRTIDETIRRVRALLLNHKLVKKGERVVLSSGGPGTPAGETTMIQVVRI
jgi:pyruvate kinase